MPMKIGLVLEGGGMRGLYTGGVLQAFSDGQWLPDYVIGVSAGACNAFSYLSGQQGRNLRINTDYLKDKRYLSVQNFLRTKSLFGMDFIFGEIPEKLDPFDYEAFRNNPCVFELGVTDVATGKPVYFSKDSFADGDFTLLRASSSIPVFAPMVPYGDRFYLDGGTSDPIPVERALQMGCDKLVVVLTRERGYQKKPERFRAAYRRAFRKYPCMAGTLDRRHTVYNQTLKKVAELEQAGKALVIAPKTPLGVDRFEKNRDKLIAVYQQGLAQGEALLPRIRAMTEAG